MLRRAGVARRRCSGAGLFRGSGLGLVQLFLDLFGVLGVETASHLSQSPTGFLGPQRATLEVNADDAHGVERSRLWLSALWLRAPG